MPSGIRLQRIADRVRQEISELLIREVNDPRLQHIFILAGLESASGFFRRILAAKVELRAFPRLRFHWDPTPENADHIEKVLAGLRNKK
jgi:ribosome-binding factor A